LKGLIQQSPVGIHKISEFLLDSIQSNKRVVYRLVIEYCRVGAEFSKNAEHLTYAAIICNGQQPYEHMTKLTKICFHTTD